MASVAVLGDDLPVGADVLAVVATETPVEIIVTNVVGMSLPVNFHIGEETGAVDVLHGSDRLL